MVNIVSLGYTAARDTQFAVVEIIFLQWAKVLEQMKVNKTSHFSADLNWTCVVTEHATILVMPFDAFVAATFSYLFSGFTPFSSPLARK